MADPEHREIFIIKRHRSHDEEHHGGAWKIAFADFMTAMMALFLVLWLISSTSDKTKHTVAQYFNPVKLVDMTTLKKGFRDPKETEMGSGPNIKPSPEEADPNRRYPSGKRKEEVNCQAGSKAAAQTEAALFRDPYAVLAEIAASASAKASTSSSRVAPGVASADDTPDPFSDPFTTTPQEQENPFEGSLALVQGKDAQGKDANVHVTGESKPQETASNAAPPQAPGPQNNVPSEEGSRVERSSEAPRLAAAAKLKSDIVNAITSGAHLPDLPHIEVQVTPEGAAVAICVGIDFGVISIKTRLSDHAARSIV